MKRGADKQLTKDDDMEDEVEQVQTGFRVANESELARREIRGLPRRTSPAVLPVIPPANSTPPAVPQKFGNFSGFGSSGGATTPFTFALAGPPQNPADAPAVSESASNATKKFASFLGPSSTAGAKPLLSSTHTLKTDASGDTDEVALGYYTSLRGLNSSFLSAVTNAIQSDPFIDIADTLEQYKKHRITVQQDYDDKSSHTKMQSAPSKSSIPPASFSFPKPATSAPATMPVPPSSFVGFGATSSAKPPTGFNTGHAPPSTPFSFSSSSSSSSSSSTAAAATAATATEPSDSQPTSAISFSPFAGAVSSSSPFKPTASKEMETTPSLKPAFSLGAASFTGPTSSAFPFGGSTTLHFSNPPKSSSLFGSEKAATEEKDKEKDKPPSSASAPFPFALAPGTKLFGNSTTSSGSSSIFGSATATRSVEDKDMDMETDKAPPLPPLSSAFGGSFGSSAKPSPFVFGTSTSTTPAQFGFGVAPGSSEGSSPPKAGSVGFSFGSPSHSPSSQSTTTTTTATPAVAAPGSVFGGFVATSTSTSASLAPSASSGGATPMPAAAAGTAGSTPTSTTASTPVPAPPPPLPAAAPTHLEVSSSAAGTRGDTPATEGSVDEDGLARTMSPGLHGGEGEGEEDEEVTYTVKAKVFKFTMDREGAPTWSEMGVGMLRLKKHNETNTRRVILRSTTTGKIVINFRIYPGLQPKRTGKTVAFTGHITSPGKDTQTAQYRLRVGTEDAAKEMTEAIEREVRLLQTDSSSST